MPLTDYFLRINSLDVGLPHYRYGNSSPAAWLIWWLGKQTRWKLNPCISEMPGVFVCLFLIPLCCVNTDPRDKNVKMVILGLLAESFIRFWLPFCQHQQLTLRLADTTCYLPLTRINWPFLTFHLLSFDSIRISTS